MKRIGIIASAGIALMLTGCPSGSARQKAAKAAKDVVQYERTAWSTEVALYDAGQSCLNAASTTEARAACIAISPEDHLFIQQQFKSLIVVGETMDSCMRFSTSAAGITACASSAKDGAVRLQGEGNLHLKSDKAKATFTSVIAVVTMGIQTIASILGGTQ